VPITETMVPAAAKALGWTPCASVRIVQWCGHGEELLPSPWDWVPVGARRSLRASARSRAPPTTRAALTEHEMKGASLT